MIDLTKLAEMQLKLDSEYCNKFNVTNEQVISHRWVATVVEIGEMLNEWGGFKYWKSSFELDRDKLLEEYVDVLHFLLSMGNTLGLNFKEVAMLELNNKATIQTLIVTMLHELVALVIDKNNSNGHLAYAIADFYMIGLKFDFTEREIENAYMDKNKINHDRIKGDY